MLPMGTWYISAPAGRQEGRQDRRRLGHRADAAAPAAPSGITTFGSPTAFAVNKKAKHAAAAKKFVLSPPVRGRQAVAQIGIVPALRTAADPEAYFALTGMPTDD